MWVGKTDAGPHGITEVSKMTPGQSLAQQGLVQGPRLKSRERLRSQEGENPQISSSFPLLLAFNCHIPLQNDKLATKPDYLSLVPQTLMSQFSQANL